MSIEGLFATEAINAYEGKEVITNDMPDEFLHPERDRKNKVLVKLTRDFVDLMCDVN